MPSLEELLSGPVSNGEPGGALDRLMRPPRNPTAPPDAIGNALVNLLQRGAQWAMTPGTIAQGAQPEVPGQWSESDQFRQNHSQDTHYQWGPEAALAMTGTPRANVAGALTSGAGSKIAQAKPSVEDSIKKVFYEIAGNPPMDAVRLHDLRAKLSHIPREEVDNALIALKKSGQANLMNLDNPRDIKAVGDAALKQGYNTYHTLWLER